MKLTLKRCLISSILALTATTMVSDLLIALRILSPVPAAAPSATLAVLPLA